MKATAAGSGWIWGVGWTVCGADGQLDACLEEEKNQGVARSHNSASLGERTGALVISLNHEIFLLVNHFHASRPLFSTQRCSSGPRNQSRSSSKHALRS